MVQLLEIEKYAKDNNIPIMTKTGIEFLKKYIKENQIKKILEIGSAIGYSAINMALTNPKIKVTTIEKDSERYKKALENISLFNLKNRINIILDDALTINIDDKYDLIFIDAAKSQYIKFFEKFKKNLNTNGVIISDNLEFHGMVDDVCNIKNRNTKQLVKKIIKYREFLENNEEFKTTIYKIGDGISVSVKK